MAREETSPPQIEEEEAITIVAWRIPGLGISQNVCRDIPQVRLGCTTLSATRRDLHENHAVVVLTRNSRGAWIALVVTHPRDRHGHYTRVSGEAVMLCVGKIGNVVFFLI